MTAAGSRIYLDHNATTPLATEVLTAMLDAGTRLGGNPSSQHAEGRAAKQAVEQARKEVAALVGAAPANVVFTSGGTEGNNTAILGTLRALRQAGEQGQLVTSPLEHPSVRLAVEQLASEGVPVSVLPVDAQGRIDPSDLRRTLQQQKTLLVSLAACNHELGNLYPVAELAALAHEYSALFHCDAVQAAGKLPLQVDALGVDLLTISAHKLYGPKGIGALICPSNLRRLGQSPDRAKVKAAAPLPPLLPQPLLVGGQQEKGRRAGTENVPAIVGFGCAAKLAQEQLAQLPTLALLRDRLETQLLTIPGSWRNGDGTAGGRNATTANLGFEGVEGDLLLMNLDLLGAAVSTGAACSSGSTEPSAVLTALGQSRAQAKAAVRFSLGRTTTPQQIDQVVEWVTQIVARVRSL